jgi:predicted ester cyclase
MHTTIEENRALAGRLGEAIDGRQWQLLDRIVAPNFVRHCQATPQADVQSLEAFKDYLRQDAAVFPDSTQTLKHIVAERDLVAIWITYTGTQQGQMGPFPPSGKRMQVDFGAILRVEDGKIAEMWVTWDNMAALAQLGHLGAPSTKSD